MTSLQLQYVLSCTSFSPPATFPKQSHFITTRANRSHRLRVFCQNQKDGGNSKIDRRNMLLGLGGLYGAANLISSPGQASAQPITRPDISDCSLATYDFKDTKRTVACCLNATGKIVDYKLPVVSGELKKRPRAHEVNTNYIEKYKRAIAAMKELDLTNDPRGFMQQANIHCAYCNGAFPDPTKNDNEKRLQVHFSWLFFPFHRWYIYFFERICGELINDPTFALPYWNWDNEDGMAIPPMFLDKTSVLFDSRRDPNLLYLPDAISTSNPAPLVDLSGRNMHGINTADVKNNNLHIMHNEMICANENAYDFMGKPYDNVNAISGAIERGCHTAVHVGVGEKNENGAGEDMGNFYSAGRDPVFYSLHANVDRLWTLWQDGLGLSDKQNKINFRKIEDPDFLDSEFVFFDEKANRVRVKVRDCLENKAMGYEFEKSDIKPWRDYQVLPQENNANKRKAQDVEFPLPLGKDKVTIQVNKKSGKNYNLLLIEGIKISDPSKFVKFDVYVNDEDSDMTNACRASYAGSFARVRGATTGTSSMRLSLSELYDKVHLGDTDDHILVTLVPKDDSPGTVEIGSLEVTKEE